MKLHDFKKHGQDARLEKLNKEHSIAEWRCSFFSVKLSDLLNGEGLKSGRWYEVKEEILPWEFKRDLKLTLEVGLAPNIKYPIAWDPQCDAFIVLKDEALIKPFLRTTKLYWKFKQRKDAVSQKIRNIKLGLS